MTLKTKPKRDKQTNKPRNVMRQEVAERLITTKCLFHKQCRRMLSVLRAQETNEGVGWGWGCGERENTVSHQMKSTEHENPANDQREITCWWNANGTNVLISSIYMYLFYFGVMCARYI